MLREYIALLVDLLLDPLDVEDLIRARGNLIDHIQINGTDCLESELGLTRHELWVRAG